MLKQTHLVVYFVFLAISSPTLLSRDITVIKLFRCRIHHHLAFAPTGARLHLAHGVRNGGEGMTAHQVRVDPSLPTATTFSHIITGPAMPKVLGGSRG
ncbi:hypothetical protein PBY51_016977 [Eleginops maclovinus]|uniref:Secreted protein n=1 Tax=Eleginops maclovinus TaxID=56733 RepID=A0AAN7WSN5_ELEMC|nr:hypothetical protein PBY51_016977 [Eleginops maclovinus]